MPSFTHHDASIYYEEFGQGFPILTFAPAGLQSVIDVWNRPSAPVNPTTEFAANFRVIAMDQRNAGGKSHAPITAQDGWHSYAADHIALLDHLGIDQCHLYGQCIGGPFIMSLLKAQPQRIACAVIAQPIGRVESSAAWPLRQLRSVDQDPAGSPRGHCTGAGVVLPESVRPRVCLQCGPRVCGELPNAMPGAGGERCGASVCDR